ncbi:MAG: EpsG family protein, partial [Lachnospiraceae bacterium]|nr:EpsG family protein [Lachnospiraceae bacterium]
MRSVWYADTGAYYAGFLSYPTTLSGLLTYASTVTKDRAFYIISAVLRLINGNARIYFLLIAFVQGICLLKFFRRYSSSYVLSIFLFVASTDVISWMFNGIRQFVAVSITLLAAPYIFQKKYFKAIVIILIASLFHQSALLLIPFMFIVQGKAWNWKTLCFLAGVMVAVAFVGQFTGWLDAALENTQYSNVVSDYTSWDDDGTNPFRVLVYSMPAIIAFFGKKTISGKGGAVINICANMSIISAGFYLISMATSGIFIGRLPIYFSLY